MTKLQEWLSAFSVLFAIWFYLVTNKAQNNFVKENYNIILYSPLCLIVLFGLYATTTVLYRVYTFNNCEEAAIILRTEIQEAKDNLTKLGFKFK